MRDDFFLIIGLGSIGRQHLRNLIALGQHNILLCRSGKGTLPDDELSAFASTQNLQEALARRPRAVIVANPTAFRVPVASAAAQAGCHLFLEKPVSHAPEGVAMLARAVEARGLCAQVGFQFRFHPALRQIKQWLVAGAIGRAVSIKAHWGEYLPGWHPWEDYRNSYSARVQLGGGVITTLCHPFDYCRWLLGEVQSVLALAGRLSGLEIEVEDVAQIILRFESGALGSVYLDYVERPPRHDLQIIGQHGKITWNYANSVATLCHADSRLSSTFAPANGFERNFMFLEEMRDFIYCLNTGAQPQCHLRDGIRALEIALAVKQSVLERREVHVQRLV